MELEENNNLQAMIDLLSKELPLIAGDNFNYVMLYFERILAEYTLNGELWTLFMEYTDDMCKNKQQRLAICKKATKNCSSEIEFWLSYMRELEKNEVDSTEYSETVMRAIEKGGEIGGIEFQFEILKTFCEFYVRQFISIPGQIPDQEGNPATAQKVNIIRSIYTDAIENLQQLNPTLDSSLIALYCDKLRLSWVEVEAYKIQDRKKVQELMEEYVKRNGAQLMSWANYIKLMRGFPDHEKAVRGLFKRGISIVHEVQSKSQLAELWLEWEKK